MKRTWVWFFAFFCFFCIGFGAGHYTKTDHIEHHGKTILLFNRPFLIIGDGSIPQDAMLMDNFEWKVQMSWATVETLIKEQSK